MKKIPPIKRIKEYFEYNKDTGELIFKERHPADFSSEALLTLHIKRIGKKAGCIGKDGYDKVSIDGTIYLAHRIIWVLVYGEKLKYPAEEIDHINGNKSDNRLVNLRKATKSANQRNGSMRKNNKSGVIGVNWVYSKNRWVARIWDGPRHKFLGQFVALEDARQARLKAEQEIGYHSGHGKQKPL